MFEIEMIFRICIVIYFYRLETGKGVKTKKMSILK